jgi:hypothetical protein
MPRGFGRLKQVFLIAALIGVSAFAAVPAPTLRLVSETQWSGDNPAHGGFSAISVTADGLGFIALSDKGNYVKGRLSRENGEIVAVEADEYGPLLSTKGESLADDDFDSEGLAIAPDGTTYVSFEANDRIAVSSDIGASPTELLRHDDFGKLQSNSSLEALAIAPDGVLIAIPERSGRWERPFPVFRWKDGVWLDTWALPRSGEYLVTDAAFGADGKLYLLERELALFDLGFSSRIRRFSMGKDGFDAGETLLETAFGTHGNLEGISLWNDPNGQIRLTMISDDNFSMFLSTEIVEYVVVD